MALQADIFNSGVVREDKLVSFLTDRKNTNQLKKSIWCTTNSSSIPQGRVHGIVLMLMASGMLLLEVVSKNKIGMDDILPKDINVILSKQTVREKDGSCYDQLSISDHSNWIHFNLK